MVFAQSSMVGDVLIHRMECSLGGLEQHATNFGRDP